MAGSGPSTSVGHTMWTAPFRSMAIVGPSSGHPKDRGTRRRASSANDCAGRQSVHRERRLHFYGRGTFPTRELAVQRAEIERDFVAKGPEDTPSRRRQIHLDWAKRALRNKPTPPDSSNVHERSDILALPNEGNEGRDCHDPSDEIAGNNSRRGWRCSRISPRGHGAVGRLRGSSAGLRRPVRR